MSFIGLSKSAPPQDVGVHTLVATGFQFYYDNQVKRIDGDGFSLFIQGRAIFNKKSLTHKNVSSLIKNASGTYSYCVIFTDGSAVVGTDKMGFYPFYYTNDHKLGFNFANTIPHLKHQLKELTIDYDFWQMILAYEDIFGNSTPFIEIKRLREGETIFISNIGEVNVSSEAFINIPDRVNIEVYVAKSNLELELAIDVLSKDSVDILIPLTGGEDSRRIADAASRMGVNYYSLTQRTVESSGYDLDGLLAQEIASNLNLSDHKVIPSPTINNARKQMLTKDYWSGFQTTTHDWVGNLITHIHDESLIFDGIVGDVSINQHFYHHNLKGLNQSEHKDAMLCSPFFSIKPKFLKENSIHVFNREFERYDFAEDNQVNVFSIFNHTRRNVTQWYTQLLLEGHSVALPYAHQSFFEQQLTLKDCDRTKFLYQKLSLEKVNPKLAKIPSTRDNITEDHALSMGANKYTDDNHCFCIKKTPFHPRVWDVIEQGFKASISNKLFLTLKGQEHVDGKRWYYLPLQRFSNFLYWCESDETELPLLHYGEVPFIKERTYVKY